MGMNLQENKKKADEAEQKTKEKLNVDENNTQNEDSSS